MKANKNHSSPKVATSYYHYAADTRNLSDYKNAANWELTTDPDGEGCPNSGDVPCIVTSSQSSVSAFVASISTVADVENNEYATKD